MKNIHYSIQFFFELVLITFFAISGYFPPGPIFTSDSIQDCEVGEGYALMGIKWDTFPIKYYLNISRDMQASIIKAFDIWDDLFPGELFLQVYNSSLSSVTISKGPMDEPLIDILDASIAYASIHWEESNIGEYINDEAIIVFDETKKFGDLPFSCDDLITETFDTLSVALHEIGHVLGLGHFSLFTLTMFSNNVGSYQQTLAKGDIDGFYAIYGGN